MSKVRLSVDEVIATLQRSFDPTLIAEGVDDILMLRRLEDRFEQKGLSILPVGGRSTVLEIFRRRAEIGNENVVIFLADQDCWVYSKIPADYIDSKILFTDGYSIENDFYRDGQLERLLTAAEKASFKAELDKFLRWYSLMMIRNASGAGVSVSVHPSCLLDNNAKYVSDMTLTAGEVMPIAELTTLREFYTRLLRGKSLMALLLRHLSSSNRAIKHSKKSLMEHASVAGGQFVERIASWVETHM